MADNLKSPSEIKEFSEKYNTGNNGCLLENFMNDIREMANGERIYGSMKASSLGKFKNIFNQSNKTAPATTRATKNDIKAVSKRFNK